MRVDRLRKPDFGPGTDDGETRARGRKTRSADPGRGPGGQEPWSGERDKGLWGAATQVGNARLETPERPPCLSAPVRCEFRAQLLPGDRGVQDARTQDLEHQIVERERGAER